MLDIIRVRCTAGNHDCAVLLSNEAFLEHLSQLASPERNVLHTVTRGKSADDFLQREERSIDFCTFKTCRPGRLGCVRSSFAPGKINEGEPPW